MVSKVEDAPNKSLKLATWQNAGNFHAIHVPVARAIPISGSSTGAFGGFDVHILPDDLEMPFPNRYL
jgi:hypothetical protein